MPRPHPVKRGAVGPARPRLRSAAQSGRAAWSLGGGSRRNKKLLREQHPARPRRKAAAGCFPVPPPARTRVCRAAAELAGGKLAGKVSSLRCCGPAWSCRCAPTAALRLLLRAPCRRRAVPGCERDGAGQPSGQAGRCHCEERERGRAVGRRKPGRTQRRTGGCLFFFFSFFSWIIFSIWNLN